MSPCGGKGPELSLSVSVEVGAHVRVVVHGLLYVCMHEPGVHGMSMSTRDARGKVREPARQTIPIAVPTQKLSFVLA